MALLCLNSPCLSDAHGDVRAKTAKHAIKIRVSFCIVVVKECVSLRH